LFWSTLLVTCLHVYLNRRWQSQARISCSSVRRRTARFLAKSRLRLKNSPASITIPRVDVSVTNGGSPWEAAARLDILPTDSKQFDKTSKKTMHVKLVRFADADKVVGGLPHFSEHVSDDEFVPDKQPNDDPPSLPKNMAEYVKSSHSISLADLPKMHRTLDDPSRSQFAHILRQVLNVDNLPEDLQNAADLVHDHCVIGVKYSRPVPRPRVALPSVHQPGVCVSVDYGDIHYPSRGKAFRVLIMADDFSGRVYASIVDDASVTGERTAGALMMLSCETFAKVTIDLDTRFDNNFFRILLGRIRTEVRTVPTDAHWASHAEKPVHLLRVAFTIIAAENAKLSPEAVLALAVRSVNSMKTSTGLSRLEIDCGRPAIQPPLSEELFALSPPVLPASAHEIEEFMNAADEKIQLHQVMRARQRLNASLRAQVSGHPPALRNGDSFLYWRTSVVRSHSGWRGPAIVIAQQRNMVIGFMGGIVVLCHRTRARLFIRSSRDEKPSPLLDNDAFLPFQGNGVDSSASSALIAQDADDSSRPRL
jgi:hypothetical protein